MLRGFCREIQEANRQSSASYINDHINIMLNKAELRGVLKLYGICCILGLLPKEVDLASGQIKVPSLKKRCISALSYSFFVLHALYKWGSLAYVFFYIPNVQLHQLVIHGGLALAGAMTIFWYNKVYHADSELLAAYFSVTLSGNIGGPLQEADQLERSWAKKLREFSVQDWLASTLPWLIAPTTAFVLAAYAYDPSMRHLLYAALPGHLQCWATFGLCLLEECRFLLFITLVVTPFMQMQIISYDHVTNQLQLLIRRMQNGRYGPKRVNSFLRGLQLYVTTLNSFNRFLVFSQKLLLITLSIISGYAAVAHFHDHPIFGVMYYVILMDATISYIVLNEKAFKIPRLFNDASTYAQLHMQANRRTIFGKQMLSIPPTGIKVGNFNTLERASTLIFINFVVVNIVNMLVAYA